MSTRIVLAVAAVTFLLLLVVLLAERRRRAGEIRRTRNALQAISHGIIHDHHGTISVHSRPGEGTTFTVTFPVDTANGA